jgi:hypothetical protein
MTGHATKLANLDKTRQRERAERRQAIVTAAGRRASRPSPLGRD